MSIISEINIDTAPENIKKIVVDHVAEGHTITAEKRTLLHNAAAFNAVEAGSYALDDELARLIGKRAADFYEYAISQANGCLVCSIYFRNLLKKNGIDFDTFEFTPEEQVLIDYGRAIANDPKHVPEELFTRLKTYFNEEQIVVVTASWQGLTASCSVVCTPPQRTGVVTDAELGLNVRSGPDTTHSIIGSLKDGDTVVVLGEENGWYQILYADKSGQAATGYVSGSYLTVAP